MEEARRRRLLEDSDSEEEAAAPAPPRLAVRPRPTAILEEVSVPASPKGFGGQQRGGGRPGTSGQRLAVRQQARLRARIALSAEPAVSQPLLSH